ncbi:carbohydrate kinase family protein [Oscillochloris sp. ZM17-4]|uniref:carbohydrate kinase family protein n=1 Tax=Oscillochloris sp. ZM17-4 TaxID=2866714 RepID=UPI001C72BAD1|nr:carbohydrate kinase family protein [Oscillochloris sp. ZM17-4]MBX0330673.1 carbohydrate kinase family protein [Oscillochloris sp. ZM17-4]
MQDEHQPQAVAVLGDINVDLSFALSSFPREGDDTQATALHWGSGGSGLNIAVALANLGARAHLIGRVGGDPAAAVALRVAQRAGVDLSSLQTDPEVSTGLCGVMVSPGGQRSFLSFRGANVRCDPAAISRSTLAGCGLLIIGGHALLDDSQRAAALRAIDLAVAAGIPCALDLCLPAIRSARRIIAGLIPKLWLLTLNEDELRALLPGQSIQQASSALIGAGLQAVAIKRGAQGCSVAYERTRIDVLPPAVSVVDTNGCGDAFTAGFAWALLNGGDLSDCAALGNMMGALTATRHGAADAIPTRPNILGRLDPEIHYLIKA